MDSNAYQLEVYISDLILSPSQVTSKHLEEKILSGSTVPQYSSLVAGKIVRQSVRLLRCAEAAQVYVAIDTGEYGV